MQVVQIGCVTLPVLENAMFKSSSTLAAASTVIAVGLLADNIRLRMSLKDVPAAASHATQLDQTKQTQKSMPRAAKQTVRTQSTRVPASPAVSEDDIEDRIVEEVEARLSEAVDQKLNTDLDSLVNEKVEQRIEQRHEERRERFRAAMEESIAEFVADRGHSDEIEAQMITVVGDAMSTLGDMFRSVQSGDMEREDVREEMGAIRDDLETTLTELLGEEEAELFQQELGGPLGRRGFSR